MELNENKITGAAWIFGSFLALLLTKYILYDNGFAFSNILLILGIVYVRLFFLIEESPYFQECAALIFFLLFDKDLLDIGNVFLLLGVACIREQFQSDLMMKELASLGCGLIFLLMGWFNVGKVFVMYFLIICSYQAIIYVGGFIFIMTIFSFFSNNLDIFKNKVSSYKTN